MNKERFDQMVEEMQLTRDESTGMLLTPDGGCVNPYIFEWSALGKSWGTLMGVRLTEQGAREQIQKLIAQDPTKYYRAYRANELDECITYIEHNPCQH